MKQQTARRTWLASTSLAPSSNRLSRIGFIDGNGQVNGDMIQGYYRNSSNYKLPTAFDGPADIETLASFFNRGGLEVWLRFAGFNVDAETIVAGLEKVTAAKPKIGHLLKAEHEQSGNYYTDMEWRTICPPRKESFRRDSFQEETIPALCFFMSGT